MDNLSGHNNLLGSVTSLLIRGIQMEELSKLGWLIRLVKHSIWSNSMHIFPAPAVIFNFQNFSFIPDYSMTLLADSFIGA
jgi:hypothetical protein